MDIEKEDGQNDYVICQLKSTDAQSIKVNQKDIRVLENNAITAHKLPLFAIQFLNTNEVWLMAKPEDFGLIAEYINTGKTTKQENIIETSDVVEKTPVKTIKSSENARLAFEQDRISKYNKTRSAR